MQRDNRLDYLKGLSCLLMIFAHSKVNISNEIIKNLIFLGGFAPILFFGVSGITATLQLRKRSLGDLLLFYFLFFILGFAFNGIEQVKYWTYTESEIIQCIAINTIISAALYHWLGFQKIGWLIPIPFILHLASYHLGLAFPYKQFIVNPGIFPIFPWLSFFLLGIYLYYCKDKDLKKVSLFFCLILIMALVLGDDYRDKWDMTVSYFCLAVLLFTGFLMLLGKLKQPITLLIYLGKNSLLFLFTHYLVLRTVFYYGIHQWYFVWIINTIFTLLLMKLLMAINIHLQQGQKTPFRNPLIWGVIIGLIMVNPLVLSSDWVYRVSFPLGFVIALNYHHLLSLVADYSNLGRQQAIVRNS